MRKILFLIAVLLLGLTACAESDISVTGVELNYNTVALTVGETKTKIATVLPHNATNQNIAWRSSNSNVATVDANGVVTALSEGATTITVTTQDGARTATSTVTVVTQEIPVASVSLNITETTLTVGDTKELVATVEPYNATNQTIAWRSSNSNVATVDANGVVTALSEGATTITVTTQDGARTATSTVTVVAQEIPVASVSLNITETTLTIGDTKELVATVEPYNATNQNVTWTSSDPNIATVDDNGQVTAVAQGTTTITVTTEDGNHTANSIVTVVCAITCEGVVINGVRWAKRNVDAPRTFAASPEDAGMFFQWNRHIGWSSTDPMINSIGGSIWNSSTPAGTAWYPQNDPCPSGWRIPTQEELLSLGSGYWTNNWNNTGVSGRVFGTVTDQVFLPAAGSRDFGGALLDERSWGYWNGIYWGRAADNVGGWFLYFDSNDSGVFPTLLFGTPGFSVRCVTIEQGGGTVAVTGVSLNRTSITLVVGGTATLTATISPANTCNQNVTWTSSNPDIATVDANGRVTAIEQGTATITVTTEDGNHTANSIVAVVCAITCEGVVINGVRWAKRNVDAPRTFATSPEDAGMFYQWNRHIGWSSTDPMVNSIGGTIWDCSVPAGTAWYPQNDPCPSGWRIPTQEELLSLGSGYWTNNWNNTGVSGRVFGTVTDQIFLPAAGSRCGNDGSLHSVGEWVHYWSSTPDGTERAQRLGFSRDVVIVSWGWRQGGFSVRCVSE